MTALNWVLTEDLVLVASDTLVVHAETRKPFCFGTKVFPIAHAKTLITGTGVFQPIFGTAFAVATRSVCRHVTDIAENLQPTLIRENETIPAEMTSTAYVFGWDEDEKRMRGFAFRSKRSFVPEELAIGLGVKPAISVDAGSIEPFEPFFIDLITRQRRADETKPSNERVGIGGEIVLARLDPDSLTLRTIYQFDDYPEIFNAAAAAVK